MDLYTRCPHCDTTFRVTTQQLQVSGGQVRCGSCARVFDAFATLTAQAPSVPATETMPPPAEIIHASSPVASPEPVAAAQPVKSVPSSQTGSRLPPARSAAKPAAADRPDPAASLYEWEFRMPDAPRRNGLWLGLSMLLLTVLAAQAAYAFRTELTIILPQTRELYLQACARLGCSVALPRLSAYLHIDASDLKVVDPMRPNEIELALSVRNRAPVGVDYPAFELTLTNAQDQTIARRVFMPSEYLEGADSTGGLGAGAELPVRLFLDTGTLRAAGYRLYLFYP
jgi:predicted Zn finger-like uncharacterized protein